MKLPIKGIIPPIVTPLLSDSKLDEPGLKNLIEHLISGGVHGIFLLGTTGEGPNLSYKLRKEFIKKACENIDNRIPIMVGITDTCLEGSLEIAETAKNEGADAVVIAAPYYLPMSQSEMVEYLENLTPKLPLPFLMYNMPSCTKMHMTIDTVRKARELGAIGIKDSSGDWNYMIRLIESFKDFPDFSLIAGAEAFLPETIFNGGHGAVAGGANLYPRLFVDLYDASVAKDMEKVEKLREIMLMIHKKIYDVGPYTSKYIKTIKSGLAALGICSDYVASPFTQFGKQETEQIRKNITELNLINKKTAH